MMSQAAPHVTHRPTLRCVSGPLRGQRWTLDGLPARIGRSEAVEITLPEEQVSRVHALFERAAGDARLRVTDLGSTNGTFVNGRRLEDNAPHPLEQGDRVLIGVSIFAFEHAVEPVVERSGIMAGRLEAVGLASILQLLGGGQRTALLHLDSPRGEGLLSFEAGRVVGAEIHSELGPVRGEKAFYRAMTWESGLFVVLEDPPAPDADRSLDADPMSLLLEGARQQDELNAHIEALGVRPLDAADTLTLPTVVGPPLRELTPEALDTLQLAHNHGVVGRLLDASLACDAATLHDLLELVARGYLTRL